MPNHIDSVVDVAKERLRQQISDQVAAFLQSGGRIDVVLPPETHKNRGRGSVWYNSNAMMVAGEQSDIADQ